jgi:hypothetical protein
LAAASEHPAAAATSLDQAAAALDQLRLPPADPAAAPRLAWVLGQLARAETELGAMLLATREA